MLILLVLVLLSFLFLRLKLSRHGKLNLPPSPPKLPIIGYLHQLLGTLPHHSLQSLSNKYGPLMFMHLGHSPTLVVSSAEMAREITKTHDIVFSNRPKTTAANVFVYGCKNIGFSPYGEYWRQGRKTRVLGLLSVKKVQSFQYVREQEAAVLINKIRCSCLNNAEDGTHNSKFGELSRRLMVQFTSFCFGDVFPSLGCLDVLTGKIGRMKATLRAIDALLDQVIEEHRISDSDDERDRKDLVKILLQLQKDHKLGIELTQDNLKAILMDMFVGGIDTTSTTLEWAMAELMKSPGVMRKAQEGVRGVVVKGKSNVERQDIDQMHYLKCVIKETLRLHPPVPLLVPRETSTSVNPRGYDMLRNFT